MGVTHKEFINFVRDELVLSGRWDVEDLPGDLEMMIAIEMVLEMNGLK